MKDRISKPIHAIPEVAPLLLTLFIGLAYVLTATSYLTSDANHWIELIEKGSDGEYYGIINHFLQIPYSHGIVSALRAIGINLSGLFILRFFDLIASIVAAVYFGLICERLLSDTAQVPRGSSRQKLGFVPILLFAGNLSLLVNWNGELYAVPIALYAAAVYEILRGSTSRASLFLSLAILHHIEFVLLVPSFFVLLWMDSKRQQVLFLKRAASFSLQLAAFFSVILVTAVLCIKGLSSPRAIVEYVLYGPGRADVSSIKTFEHSLPKGFLKALKGLFSGYNISGHVLGDVLTGKAAFFQNMKFALLELVASLAVVFSTLYLIWLGRKQKKLWLYSLSAMLPVLLFFNLRYYPVWMKYHSASLLGLNLIIVAGLYELSKNSKPKLVYAYLVLMVGSNLFGSVIPMKFRGTALEQDTLQAKLFYKRDHKISVVSCEENSSFRDFPEMRNFRVDSLVYQLPQLENTDAAHAIIRDWVRQRLAEGRRVYLLGDACDSYHWEILAREARKALPSPQFIHFDFSFLKNTFALTDTGQRFQVDAQNFFDPLGWKEARLLEVRMPGTGAH